ncbi:MAG: Zn-dependent hydrolase [Hymenobacter sp.]|nr:MAG: Zn-dependent hydrolase [Hymenobacter sp.]
MTDYLVRTARILARIEQLAAISEDAEGVTRTFGTPAFVRGRELVQSWFAAAGLATQVDAIGNLRGRRASARPAAKTFVLASHIDTVVNAGKYDGPLGVLLALDLAESIIEQGVALPFNLEIIAFSDEEGVRFHTTYLGSKVLTGAFDPATLQKTDAHGITLAQAIADMGGDPRPAALAAAALPPAEWLGYFELHIEQGPVLWENRVPIALVTAVAGQQRVELTWQGMAGHAGTVPMPLRQDALAAAAEFVLAAEAFALAHGQALVATVGQLRVPNSASNVIPGQVVHSLDLRSPDAGQLAAAYEALHGQAEAIAARRGVVAQWQLVQHTAPVPCDTGLNQVLAQAIAASGHEVVRLVSGAGHDVVPASAVAPATMAFIRCYKGISHNPLENVEAADVAAALAVAERFLLELVKQQS